MASATLTAISAEEFEAIPPTFQVLVHEHARRFAALALSECSFCFALSWRSDLVKPVMAQQDNGNVWVGVDQRVVCVSPQGRVLCSCGLVGLVLSVHCFEHVVGVLCDSEALLFNGDYSIRGVWSLRDVPLDLVEENGGLVVAYGDGTRQAVR